MLTRIRSNTFYHKEVDSSDKEAQTVLYLPSSTKDSMSLTPKQRMQQEDHQMQPLLDEPY